MSATADAALAKLTARERTALLAQLRRELRDELTAEDKARRERRRANRANEPEDVAAGIGRQVTGLATRCLGDVDSLHLLVELRAHVDSELDRAVVACHTGAAGPAWSWSEIGGRLGMTRQAARQRWGAGAA